MAYFRTPPMFGAPGGGTCYDINVTYTIYTAENYILWATIPSLTIQSFCKIPRNSEIIRTRSSKVINPGVNQKLICDFLLQ